MPMGLIPRLVIHQHLDLSWIRGTVGESKVTLRPAREGQ